VHDFNLDASTIAIGKSKSGKPSAGAIASR